MTRSFFAVSTVLALLCTPIAALDSPLSTTPGATAPAFTSEEFGTNRSERVPFFKNTDGTIGRGSRLKALPSDRNVVEQGDVSDLCVKAVAGSVCRSLGERAADVSVGQDYGVTTAASDQSPALAGALNAAGAVVLPKGTYTLNTPLAVPPATALSLRPGAVFVFSRSGSLSLGGGARYDDSAYGTTKDQEAVVRAFGVTRPSGGQDPFGLNQHGVPAFMHAVASDNSDLAGNFSLGTHTLHKFGGSTTRGGRIAHYTVLDQTLATNVSNPNRNYVGMSGIAITRSGDDGTDTANGAKGAYFGSHGYCQNIGGRNLLECAGVEFNTYMASGTSAQIVAGVTSVGNNRVQGVAVDAAYDVGGGTEFNGTHIGWRHGLTFTNVHAGEPLNAQSILIGSTWLDLSTRLVDATTYRTIYAGLDLRGFNASQAGVLGRANGSGNFLEFLNSAGTSDLFAVSQAGRVQTTGIMGRSGTDGAVGGAFYNFNWNGSGLEAYVDAVGVGIVVTRNISGSNIGFGTPASSTSLCTQGQMMFDASYIYTCQATNSWKRIASGAEW